VARDHPASSQACLVEGMPGQLGDRRGDHRFDRFSVSALSETSSKSACAFSHNIEGSLGLGQLSPQPVVVALQPLVLGLLRAPPAGRGLGRHTVQRARVAGPAPLHHM
jgi:hypothetical protein